MESLFLKIIVAGFEHETNTFAPSKAAYSNFEKGEGYPAMMRGKDVLSLRNVNIAAGGFIKAVEAAGHEIIPVIWAGASASAHVTTAAFERISGEIMEALRREVFDAVFLNLHGAMVTEDIDDGEGEILERARAIVGTSVPIVASLDLHGNVTRKMLANADGLIAYRTYPHVDMSETGRRAAEYLEILVSNRGQLFRADRRLPFLIPINAMCTMVHPALAAYTTLEALETKEVVSLSFAPGFPASDFPECGPVVWGYGTNQQAVEDAVERLYEQVLADEEKWRVTFLSPDEAVAQAMQLTAESDGIVIISDTQDNPGAGGDGNTTGMLRSLVRLGAKRAALGVFFDPQAVAAATQAGVGSTVLIALGGTSGTEGDEPFEAAFEVEYLSDGKCTFEGPMFNGNKVDLGGVACLKVDDVRVVVSATKAQMFDRELYRVAGINPEEMRILVNKSSVHFRADFGPIAHTILVAKSPGPMKADPLDLPWTRLAEGMRITPGGPTMKKL
ncbi:MULTISPECIES: M81 family metallopeptidase [unclassified Phyllobacterium]|uniref:M81 family metallopeptidase n=1 Tax=unclassified Phyllobacterium TaxID=2638441 RepID=UPI003012C979